MPIRLIEIPQALELLKVISENNSDCLPPELSSEKIGRLIRIFKDTSELQADKETLLEFRQYLKCSANLKMTSVTQEQFNAFPENIRELPKSKIATIGGHAILSVFKKLTDRLLAL